MTTIHVPDDPQTLRETFRIAQTLLGSWGGVPEHRVQHAAILQRLIDGIERRDEIDAWIDEYTAYVTRLRSEVERLRLQVAGEPITAELESTPTLAVDQQLRVQALHAAARIWAGRGVRVDDDACIATARLFEEHLREER